MVVTFVQVDENIREVFDNSPQYPGSQAEKIRTR